MNQANKKLKLSQKATQLAVCKLGTLSAFTTQKRALSFLKPASQAKPAMFAAEQEQAMLTSQKSPFQFFSAEASRTTLEGRSPDNLLTSLSIAELVKERKQAFEAANLRESSHIDLFWKEWLGGLAGNSEKGSSGDANRVWEEWLRDRGILPGNDEQEAKGVNGWSDPNELSELEDDAWIAGGMRRPGEQHDEGFSSEEALEDSHDDDDDDDYGGHMMPIPNMG